MQRNFSLALTSMLEVFTSQTYHYYHYHNNFEIPKNEGQILILQNAVKFRYSESCVQTCI